MNSTQLNRKLWAIHNWTGVYFGIVISILSLTGAIAVFKFEIDYVLNRDLFFVTPQSGVRISPEEALEKAIQTLPTYNVLSVEVPRSPTHTWQVHLFKKGKVFYDADYQQVGINPYTGELTGVRDFYRSTQFFIRNIHVRLYESLYGRQIVGLAGIALLISSITGLLIYGNFMKKQFFGTIRWRRNIRIVNADWHKMIGVAALIFNLMIAVTGTWLGLQAYLMKWFDIERPNRTFEVVDKPLTPKEDAAFECDYQAILLAAQEAFPALWIQSFQFSTDGSRSVTILGDIPGLAYERHINTIMLDKQTHEVLYTYDIRDRSWQDKLFFVQESLHFGDFGGIGLKILYCLLGLTSGALSITGFVIYLHRTRTQKRLTRKHSQATTKNLVQES